MTASPTADFRGKRVTVFRNGDENPVGKTITVTKRKYPNIDKLCDYVGDILNGYTRGSCIRRLCSAGGTRVREIEDIVAGRDYFACEDNYSKLRYGEIHGKKPPFYRQKDFNKPYFAKPIRPVLHARDEHLRNKSGRARYLNEHCRGLRLRVHSQKRSNPCQPVAVPHFQTKNFDKIREIISEAVGINEKSLLIYKFEYGGEGCQLVNRAEDLNTDDAILAVYKHNYRGKPYTPKDLEVEKYQPGGYANFTTQISGSPRKDDQVSPRPYRHKKSLNKYKEPLPSIGSSSKQSGPISPYSNPPSQGGRTQHSNKSRPSRQVDYDADQSGIYRAKGQDNSRGAKQVNETRDTHTERPIDQMEAEEVAEEEFLSKEKTTPIPPGTELNKKPSAEQKQDTDAKMKKKSEVKKNIKTNGKDKLYVSEIPPVVDEEKSIKVNKDDIIRTERTEDKESQVGEDTFENYKEKNTPKELQTDTVSPNKPPLSTSPPDSSKGLDTKERINEDMGNDLGNVDIQNENQNEALREEVEREGQQHDPWDDSYEQTERSNNPRNSTPASAREARLREEQKQTQAATKLQAGARGWKARKEFKAKKQQENNRRQEEEIRRHEDEMRKRDEDSKRQNHAATKIQAGFKGYKVRKERRDKLQGQK